MNSLEYKIEFTYELPGLQRSDIFYADGSTHNHVAKVSFKDKTIHIYCDGEMDFTHNEVRVRNSSQLDDAGIYTDLDVKKIDQDQWMNNPWFDAYLEENGEIEHLDVGMLSGDIYEIILSSMEWLGENA